MTGSHLHRDRDALHGRCSDCGTRPDRLAVYCAVCGARLQTGARAGASIAMLVAGIVVRVGILLVATGTAVYLALALGRALVEAVRR